MLKEKKIRSEKHRRFIAQLPCCRCSAYGRTQAAHIRHGNGAGIGLKSGDDCTVPLCVECHADQHDKGEIEFWEPYGGTKIATRLAKELFALSGNIDHALIALERFR